MQRRKVVSTCIVHARTGPSNTRLYVDVCKLARLAHLQAIHHEDDEHKSVAKRTCALRWLAHLRPAATRRAQCTEQKRPDPYVRSWAVPHDSQALAGAGATGDPADAATTDAAAAVPRTGVVPRPDGGVLPPTALPGMRREGFSGGPKGRVAANVGATAALPLVATGGCFRARRDGGGGEEEGEGVTTEEGGVTAGGSVAVEAGACRQVRQRPAAHRTHHAQGRGKKRGSSTVRCRHYDATEKNSLAGSRWTLETPALLPLPDDHQPKKQKGVPYLAPPRSHTGGRPANQGHDRLNPSHHQHCGQEVARGYDAMRLHPKPRAAVRLVQTHHAHPSPPTRRPTDRLHDPQLSPSPPFVTRVPSNQQTYSAVLRGPRRLLPPRAGHGCAHPWWYPPPGSFRREPLHVPTARAAPVRNDRARRPGVTRRPSPGSLASAIASTKHPTVSRTGRTSHQP